MAKPLSPERVVVARAVAFAADAVQIWLFPLFAGGVAQGADAVLEVIVGLLLCWICGFHPAFLPTFIGEALPIIDLFPSWTLATLYVTRKSKQLPASPRPNKLASR
jgi:hypothetical protein